MIGCRYYSGLLVSVMNKLKYSYYPALNLKSKTFYRYHHCVQCVFWNNATFKKNILSLGEIFASNKNVCLVYYGRPKSSKVNSNTQKLELYLKDFNARMLESTFNFSGDNMIFNLLKEKEEIEENIKQLESMMHNEGNTKNEKEMLELIESDLMLYRTTLKDTYEKIVYCLVPKGDFEDCCDIVLEITAGVGGVEAMLFASDLRKMYCGFLDYKGWQYCFAENDKSELGGLRHCSLLVSGPGAYSILQLEAGVHRVQRVPATEKAGRMHTSTVSVAVLPQPSDIEVNIKDTDLKIETKRASGAGGQHVNTTESAVRITHIPTGIVVECQNERSQIINKQIALLRLKTKIYEKELMQVDSSTRAQRKLQVGTSSRSEKIRTYNFRDDRISDHRFSTNLHNMKEFLEGGEALDELLIRLKKWHDENRVQQFIDSLPS